MTNVRKLTEFPDEFKAFVESKENPDEWYVLIGNNVGNYSVHTSEKPDEYDEWDEEMPAEDRDANESVDGFYQIGSSGWVAKAFEDGCGFVGEYSHGDKLDARMMHMLLVHEDMLNVDAIEAAAPDPEPSEEVSADD